MTPLALPAPTSEPGDGGVNSAAGMKGKKSYRHNRARDRNPEPLRRHRERQAQFGERKLVARAAPRAAAERVVSVREASVAASRRKALGIKCFWILPIVRAAMSDPGACINGRPGRNSESAHLILPYCGT